MRLLSILCIVLILASCATKSTETDTTETPVESRYSYTNEFVIGDASNIAVLRNWNNALAAKDVDKAFSYVADSLAVVFDYGKRMSGTNDAMLDSVKAIMNGLDAISVGNIAHVSVASKNKGDQWVLAYTDETYTDGGTPNRVIVHEVYRMVNGKIRSVYQYSHKPVASETSDATAGDNYSYSSSFEVNNNDHLAIVEGFLDAMVSRNFEAASGYLADSVYFVFPDGNLMNTVKDSVMAMASQYFSENNINIAYTAGVPVHSTDRNEDWVLLWTDETIVNPEGVKTEVSYHDAYRIVNNKIRSLRIFAQQRAQK